MRRRVAGPRAGDPVRVVYPGHVCHRRLALVEKVWRARVHGFDLGRLAALRFADGTTVALPLDKVRAS